MIPLSSTTPNLSPTVAEAWVIATGTNRSESALSRLQALHSQASGQDKSKIAKLIEAFLVDGGLDVA